ncbi:MAG: bacterial proteasome activator family protein [Actinomycetota bacterium]|nr:bacterial proteasome activator family protein [Actinomycetota bacterium]
MSDEVAPEAVLVPPQAGDVAAPPSDEDDDAIQQPAKVMRIGAMVRQLLEEVRQAPLDDASRTRLREIYENSVGELSRVLPPDLKEELTRLSLPFDDGIPSDAELRIAHAQLVGWLEGLFHGIQAMLFAQQMESRARLEEMRKTLPPGPAVPEPGPGGNYL